MFKVFDMYSCVSLRWLTLIVKCEQGPSKLDTIDSDHVAGLLLVFFIAAKSKILDLKHIAALYSNGSQ